MFELSTDAYFDSAHFLPDYFGKCENLHGHRWKVTATISEKALKDGGSEDGMVCDFGKFKKIVRKVVSQFDHTFLVQEGSLAPKTIECLVEEGFSITILPFRTTAENLAKYISKLLQQEGLPIKSVEVQETPNNRAKYVCD